MAQIIYTDGTNAKSLNPWDLESNPDAWTFISNAPQNELDAMFYKVAASFRAVNKRAIAAANVPFQIMQGKTVIDDSKHWENKIKLIRKPKDLIKRVSLSLTFTNAAYMIREKDILKSTKNLQFLVPSTITPIVKDGILVRFERLVNGVPVPVTLKEMVYIWQLDHTTELLPSKNTSAQAIFNSVGGVYFQDLFIRNFFERGGVKPTVLALKGAIFNEKKEDIERGWSLFLRNLSRFSSKIFNAETMDVKPIGAGVDDLKNNEIYKQALENIALGVGMPVSELMSDFDSFATAQVDRMSWQRDDIFPHCEAIAEDLNIQVFEPMGYRLDFLTETTDAETQDEVDRAQAYGIYVDKGIKPSIAAQMVGIELPDDVEYEDLDKMAEENEAKEQEKAKQEQDNAIELQDAKKPAPVAKWIPSLDEFKELDVWRDVALRRFKKGDGLDFEYQPHYGGLPADVTEGIKVNLVQAASAEEIRAAFVLDLDTTTITPAQPYKPDTELLLLVEALNKLAEASVIKTESTPPSVVFNLETQTTPRVSFAGTFANTVFVKRGKDGKPTNG